MLFLIVASAVLLVSYRLRVDIGDGAPLPVVAAFAALYCAALALLVRPLAALHPLAAAGVAAVIVAAARAGPLAAGAGLIAIVALVHAGTQARGGVSPAAAILLGTAGAALLVVALVRAGPIPRGSPAPAYGPLALAPPEREPAPEPRAPQPAAPHDPAPAPTPAAIVRAYYRALDAHRFAAAWSRLAPAVRASFGGFAAWRAGYGHTLSSRPAAIAVIARAPGTVRLRHRLDAVDAGPGGRRASRFVVEWQLTHTAAGWKATALTARRDGVA